VKACFRTV